jgi:hypothetical protein
VSREGRERKGKGRNKRGRERGREGRGERERPFFTPTASILRALAWMMVSDDCMSGVMSAGVAPVFASATISSPSSVFFKIN